LKNQTVAKEQRDGREPKGRPASAEQLLAKKWIYLHGVMPAASGNAMVDGTKAGSRAFFCRGKINGGWRIVYKGGG
jgi:hypothetical protein